MPNDTLHQRRDVIAGLAGLGAVLASAVAFAEADAPADAHAGHAMKDAVPAPQPSAAHKRLIESTAACLKAGRFCMARCTDHLASGTALMADCSSTLASASRWSLPMRCTPNWRGEASPPEIATKSSQLSGRMMTAPANRDTTSIRARITAPPRTSNSSPVAPANAIPA